MLGRMMDRPLLISSILRHGAQVHGGSTVSSRFATEPPHRYTYSDAWRRVQRLGNVLTTLGIAVGERVGTIAWNDHRHFELYYAVPGMGAVCHTINPRLAKEQLVYIINHAQDQWLFVDPMFVPLVEGIWRELRGVKGIVVLAGPEQMPDSALPALCYETLMSAAQPHFDWPEFDERTAAGLCYTSGTTGEPKGVLYSHRSTVLHAYATVCVPGRGLRMDDTALVVVPFFHANAWGLPHSAPLIGANLVLPGPKLDGASLYSLMEAESVTLSSGVPTVWLGLLDYLRESGAHFTLPPALTSGGAALPRAMLEEFEERHGVRIFQGWGMTETSPVAALCSLSPDLEALPLERRRRLQLSAGRAVFGVEIDIIDAQGGRLPHDDAATGEIVVRGPWIADGYFENPEASRAALTADGWFRTGDVGRIDPRGYLSIVDRTKDLIKSGGEWISSAQLEAIALSHLQVAEAAAIAVAHPKWQERPVLLVVLRPGGRLDQQALLDLLATKVPSWWLPDEVLFLDSFPHGATGKVDKRALRQRLANERPLD